MKSALPLVSPDVGSAMSHDMGEENWSLKYSEHIDKTNPAVAHFLSQFVGTIPEEPREFALIAGLTTYRLLEAQAEADQLEAAYG